LLWSLDILAEIKGKRLGRVLLLLAIHPNQAIGMLVSGRISHVHASHRATRRGERGSQQLENHSQRALERDDEELDALLRLMPDIASELGHVGRIERGVDLVKHKEWSGVETVQIVSIDLNLNDEDVMGPREEGRVGSAHL
jgi:hypothetical protein